VHAVRPDGTRRRAWPDLVPARKRQAGEGGFAALWAAAVLVPLIGFGMAASIAWTQVAADARSRLSRTADMLQEHALRAFEAQNAALIAATALIRDRSWADIRDSQPLQAILAELDQATAATAGVALIAPDGTLALASRITPSVPPTDLSGRDYVLAHRGGPAAVPLTQGGTFVGEVSAGAVTGQPVFRLSRPRLGPEGMADGGVVSAAFLPAHFAEFWRSVVESPQDIVLLLRRDGAILARYPAPDDPVGARLELHDGLGAAVAGAARETLTFPDEAQGGQRRLAAVRQLGGFPVSVVYVLDPGVPRADWLGRLPAPALAAAAAAALLLLLTARAQAAGQRARQEADQRAELEARLRRSEAGAAIGQLAAGVAHDFGNMAQAVTGGARMIGAHARDPDRVLQLAGLIASQAERASALATRMLGFARRGAADGGREGRAPIDVDHVLAEVAELLRQGLRAGVRLHVARGASAPLRVRADRAELEAAIVNLCVNARDAMPSGGDIMLTAERGSATGGGAQAEGLAQGHYARIAVRDSGTGMDAATLARVGEPFFTTKPAGQGTGLGLSMARGFAVRAGGALRIESVPGAGTTVTLWLPAEADPPPDTTALPPRAVMERH
jgi:two-component system NtrC family sensor kinase